MTEPASTTAPPEQAQTEQPQAERVTAPSALRQPTAIVVFVLAFVLGLSADLVIKSVAWDKLNYQEPPPGEIWIGPLGDTVVAIPGILNFTAVANHGA
ncbi:MAG: hypothetical protein AAF743_04360, partial [Planctomycetota bacterium]